MIDSRFIIRYTNGLYTTDAANAPTYEEFRDMFSSGQIISKEWAVNELQKLGTIRTQNVIIVGAWYGTLGLMLKNAFPTITLTLLDIDPRCKNFIDNITYNENNIFAITQDMYEYKYTENVVVNTSCEHIPNVRWWLDMIPRNTIVVLQSNNFITGADHINCVASKEAFEKQTQLSEILYSGELVTPMYTRFMIIGKT